MSGEVERVAAVIWAHTGESCGLDCAPGFGYHDTDTVEERRQGCRHIAQALAAANLLAEPAAGSGRPSNQRDGACICDYNPATTDGPDECCPFHGRPYAYWIKRGDTLQARLDAATAEPAAEVGLRAAIEALADEWERMAGMNEAARGKATKVAGYYRRHASQLRAALADHAPQAGEVRGGRG